MDPSLGGVPSGAPGHHPHHPLHPGGGPGDPSLQGQLNELARTQVAMQQHMTNLSQDYQAVIGEMMNFQRNMVAQDQLMQNLIQYLVSLEAGASTFLLLVVVVVDGLERSARADSPRPAVADSKGATQQDPSAPYVPSSQAQKLISSYTEVARASYDQMADLTRRASLSGAAFPNLPPHPPPPPSFGQFDFGPPQTRGRDGEPQQQQQQQQQQQGPPPQGNGRAQYGEPSGPAQGGGGQQAQQQQQGGGAPQPQFIHPAYSADYPPAPPAGPSQQQQQPQPPPQQQQQQGGERPGAGPRRKSNVPGWTVPPRVLLVEDDAVCRKLSSKFLEVFGCQIDVAVDGVSAVNKMNTQKYDLVLMVRLCLSRTLAPLPPSPPPPLVLLSLALSRSLSSFSLTLED